MDAIERSQEEIDAVLNKAAEGLEHGSKFPGMSYEEGVRAMYDWLTGNLDEDPME